MSIRRLARPLAQALAGLTKHDLIPQNKFQHPDRLVSEALKHMGVDLIVDAGANRGQFAKRMIENGFDGTILSFEPVPATYAILAAAAQKHPNWQVFNLALGDTAGQMTIHCHTDDSLNSFLPTGNLARERYDGMDQRKEEVNIETLDSFLEKKIGASEMKSPNSIFLKLDTQGYDLAVLRGAQRTVEMITIIQSEASVNPIYEGMPDYLETLHELKKLGFKPAAFKTVSRDKHSLQFVEFDVVAIKDIK